MVTLHFCAKVPGFADYQSWFSWNLYPLAKLHHFRYCTTITSITTTVIKYMNNKQLVINLYIDSSCCQAYLKLRIFKSFSRALGIMDFKYPYSPIILLLVSRWLLVLLVLPPKDTSLLELQVIYQAFLFSNMVAQHGDQVVPGRLFGNSHHDMLIGPNEHPWFVQLCREPALSHYVEVCTKAPKIESNALSPTVLLDMGNVRDYLDILGAQNESECSRCAEI